MSKTKWLSIGYQLVAESGFQALKVEPLAQEVGISKSSFYHHFADLEVFTEALLDHHLNQAKVMAEKEKKAQSIDPELIEILLEHQLDLLFHRQLKFQQNRKDFASTIQKANEFIGEELLMLWIRDLNLPLTQKQLAGVFDLAMENFFLQANAKNLNEVWLRGFFEQLRKISLALV
ncbi:TetR/AcrR family transcriptional regulator [Algoriphagus confluentis]|uniref:HTH tetR-type domain-containing protein n=1 Tax=Algoriphagus confluentis TaxID=1697556 RepID=A0ABQ6PQL4_9BACT|nr:hypothetical protein Aconfl_29170 [Algoriphagus confluentis]